MLVDDDPGRGAILRQALTDAGYEVCNCALRGVNLLVELQRSGADVILVDMNVPDRDTLESVRHINLAALLGNYFSRYGVAQLSAVEGALERWLGSETGRQLASQLSVSGQTLRGLLTSAGAPAR